MSELIFRPSIREDLDHTVELMGLGFPGAHKFSRPARLAEVFPSPPRP